MILASSSRDFDFDFSKSDSQAKMTTSYIFLSKRPSPDSPEILLEKIVS